MEVGMKRRAPEHCSSSMAESPSATSEEEEDKTNSEQFDKDVNYQIKEYAGELLSKLKVMTTDEAAYNLI